MQLRPLNHGTVSDAARDPAALEIQSSSLLARSLQASSLAVLLFLAGCGPSFNKVNGTVSYKGKNLTMGTITFVSEDGKKKNATSIGSNGFYEAIEPPLGKVKVIIAVKPPPKIPEAKDAPKVSIGDAPSVKIEPVMIPSHYSELTRSGLSTELKSGTNTFDIELTGEVTGPGEESPKKGKKK